MGNWAGSERANWHLVAILVLAIAGIGVAGYLTVAHFDNVPLACSINGIVDCTAVTHSAYSEFGSTSMPISAAGMLWFVIVGVAAGLALGPMGNSPWLPVTLLVVSSGGTVYVLYLVYIEIVRLHRICEWCTGVHLMTLAIFLLAIVHLQKRAMASSWTDEAGDYTPSP
ncbi:MAG: vitamin K epoxide reductase family protein [Chloroflexota bacterium]